MPFGISVSKTSSVVDLTRFTPLRSTDITYYKAYDWYSLTPRSQYAKLAYGIGDGSPYMIDSLSFGDNLTYSEYKNVYETIIISSPGLDGRLSGAPLENVSFLKLHAAKRSVFRDIAVDNTQTEDGNSNQIVDARYTGKSWFQLAP